MRNRRSRHFISPQYERGRFSQIKSPSIGNKVTGRPYHALSVVAIRKDHYTTQRYGRDRDRCLRT